MHPFTRRSALAYGTLAAVFLVASLGTFFVARELFASGPPATAHTRSGPPPTFAAAAARTPKNFHPEHRDHVATLLHPAIVKISAPETIGLGDAARITLTIEQDRDGISNAAFPRIGSTLSRVDTQKSEDGIVNIFHAQAGDRITAHLYEGSSDVALPSREENPQPTGATWTWHVTGSEPGARDLEFEMFENYTLQSTPGTWPLGTMRLGLSVDPTVPQWVKYYASEAMAAWQYLVGFLGGIAGVAAAWPMVRKWLRFGERHKGAPDAQVHA